MPRRTTPLNRRDWLLSAGALAAGTLVPPLSAQVGGTAPATPLLRAIPSSGERIPAIGMGTWLTFDIDVQSPERESRLAVLKAFFAGGGRVIDSSPMYNRAEEVVGDLLITLPRADAPAFTATKVWTTGRRAGIAQIENSRELWRVPRLDLIMVHNLMDWQVHLPVLREMQAQGRVRYIGVTTSHGRREDELAQLLKRERFDVVQFTYNIADRSVEQRLLPLARDHGKAVMINRPFDGGALPRRMRGKPLPAFASELGCRSWAELVLKWVLAHPSVTCAIPATTQVAHMRENMAALRGPLPDEALRQRIAALVSA